MHAGFDIGGTNARLCLFDETFEEIDELKRRVRGRTSPEYIADLCVEMLADLVGEETGLESVGVGLAGQLSADGETVVNAPNLGWRDVPFASLLRGRIKEDFDEVNLRVVNDLSAALWGEHRRGSVRDCRDVLAVYVGTGVGGAMLVDGRLVDGTAGKAGEIGHSKVVVGGRLCGCGQRGCLEAYAGGVHLERRVGAIGDELDLDVHGEEGVDLGEADALSRTVDPIGELWEESTDYLAMILANACTLLNPAALLLGGGVLTNLNNFRHLVLQKTSPLILEAARDDLEIRFAALGDDAGVIGAAMLAA